MFVVEKGEGFHVIDVSDPAAPVNKAFVECPFCVDLVVRNGTLYADSRMDIVLFDVSDINNIRESGRLKDYLPYMLPLPEDKTLPCGVVEQQKGVVIGWEIKRVKHYVHEVTYPVYNERDWIMDDGYYQDANSSAPSIPESGNGSSSGKSGSMARLGLYENYLYVMPENGYLLVFDLDASPVKVNNVGYITGHETMFIQDKHLFFGASNGMSVYDLSIPFQPLYVGGYWHFTSCDPVVVQDHYAYITMRGGTTCGGNLNQLDIVKMSENYKLMNLEASFPMAQPYGLGIDGNMLFVCDGAEGLKIFDASDKKNIEKLSVFANIKAYDVIPVNNYLFMIGDDGFYLYDYSNPKNVKLLSHIAVKKK
ncbi:MAG: hypothetical protein LBH04_05920 [Tannerellaceae bacterium]|nr:hypothetical protein [Tannerellaceae bacterium]